MKTTAKIMVSVFFIILMVGGTYAWADDAPIWQIFENGKAVHWVDHKPNPRFAIYDSGTPNDPSDDVVLDKETGLVWERSPSTIRFNLNDAQTHCINLIGGNRMGWRLPTIQEGANLLDRSVSDRPHLPAGHPFSNVQYLGIWYWSATSRAEFTTQTHRWTFFFGGDAGGLGSAAANMLNSAWCVRGGQNYEVQ